MPRVCLFHQIGKGLHGRTSTCTPRRALVSKTRVSGNSTTWRCEARGSNPPSAAWQAAGSPLALLRVRSCTAKESNLAARTYQARPRTHVAVRYDVSPPRPLPGPGPWIRTTMTSAKNSRPTVRRSQVRVSAEGVAPSRRVELRRATFGASPPDPLARASRVSGWSRTTARLVRSKAAGSAGRDVAPRMGIEPI